MNGKQAKRLRRAAMGLAVSLDSGGRKISRRDQELEPHYSEEELSFRSNLPPSARHHPEVVAVTVHNKKDSFRGIYRYIKKGIAKGTLPGGK